MIKETKPTILVIDDEKRMLTSLGFLLEEDFSVVTASSGREGLSIFKSTNISVILLDIDMPDISGLEVLQRIRRTDKYSKIIMMTGRGCYDWAKKCADLSVQGYVEKPFDATELIDKIKDVLGVKNYPLLNTGKMSDYELSFDSMSIPIKRALNFIGQNYHGDMYRDKIAAYLDISPDYLSRLFHKECGVELQEYIHLKRIEKSKEYLSTRYDMKIREVAEAVGILDAAYFCRFFKQHTSLTPNEFRKKSLA